MQDYIAKARELAGLEFNEHYADIVNNTNYDESKVPEYSLPSALTKPDGTTIASASEWVNFQRPRILKLFRDEMYGQMPPRPDAVEYILLSKKDNALGGIAVRKEIRLRFRMNNGRKFDVTMLLYLPRNAKIPVPVFLGLNFKGNHATTQEADVIPTGGAFDPATISTTNRGIQAERWCFPEIVQRGYASATICYHDIFPDHCTRWEDSVLILFEDLKGFAGAHEKYSSIGAWAWGLSRAADCLETDPAIDTSKIAVHGHSRLGKTALWAGANDPRFRLVISNCSGCGGAALSRRLFGETFLYIVNAMPHWFIKSFRQYIAYEEKLPFDQHELISLSAPRPVVVASATEDKWADPKGEFLATVHAGEIYKLFGSKGIDTDKMPSPDTYHTADVSYHIRTGKHDQTLADWQHYLNMADIFFKKSN